MPALILATLLLACTCAAQSRPPGAAPADLVPAPCEARLEATLRPFATDRELVSDAPAQDRYALRVLRSLPSAASTRGAPPVRRIRLIAARPAGIPSPAIAEQAYSLECAGDSVIVRGESAAARLYGVQTLRQLALLHGGLVPGGRVVDAPALRVRGVSLDVSRGRMPTLDDLRQVLDLCASLKLNLVHVYFEDTFEYSGVLASARRDHAMDALTLRRLAAEARLRSIELVPIVETLAHQERMLAHDAMRRYGESARSGMLAPTKARARALAKSMVGDVLAASGASQVHLGCDEPAELGTGASAAEVRRRGVAAVFAEHVAALDTHARAHGATRTWIYADFLRGRPELAAQLPRDLVLVDWDYRPEASYASLDSLAGFGLERVVTSPGLWNWSAIRPDLPRALTSIEVATSAARTRGCLGSVLASWGDGGGEDLFGNDVLGLAWFAEHAWQSRPAALAEFLPRYARLRFGASAPAAMRAFAALSRLHVPNVAHDQAFVYRPILVRARTPAWRAAMDSIAVETADAQAALAGATGRDLYADAELEALRSTLARLHAAADRERTLDDIRIRLDAGDVGSQAWAAGELSRLHDAEAGAQAQYVRAWRAHNLESGLTDVRARFAAQLTALDSLRSTAARGRLQPWTGRDAPGALAPSASGPDAPFDGW